jgi:hypothetical protein
LWKDLKNLSDPVGSSQKIPQVTKYKNVEKPVENVDN